ncbi:MAG: ribbon-helix-helix protein, CopG family [Chloroflexi bacterium]|nr:ribbon-helix-helix protein, CopG family [Chloroflexota bacterium]
MPPRRKSRTITFSLPPEMFEQVQRVKDEEGRDMSELVREALRLYMEDRELRREQRLERLRSRRANQSDEDHQGGHTDE